MEVILKREIVADKSLCRLLGLFAFIILTALGAFVRIPLPFTPVPITLQTFFVLLSGIVLGKHLGAASQLGYLLLGISGLPIFTSAGSGLAYLSGPTGGYLFGFVIASFFSGSFIESGRDNLFLQFAILCLSSFIILACGTLWLKAFFGRSMTVAKLLQIGFIPFIPADLVKALFALAIYSKLKFRIKQIF